MQMEQLIGAVVDELGSTATSRSVAGAPVEVGGVQLVVLSTLSIGMGVAEGEGEGDGAPRKGAKQAASPGGGAGEGVGGGAKVRPSAVIAFTADGVQVLSIPDQPGPIDKLVEKMPRVAEVVEQVRATFQE